jgi:hypothetical protein
VAADVTLLTIADRLAARGIGPTASADMIEAHLALAREVLPTALAWHRDASPRAPIRGDHPAAAIGIEPGPELGRVLAKSRPRSSPASGFLIGPDRSSCRIWGSAAFG